MTKNKNIIINLNELADENLKLKITQNTKHYVKLFEEILDPLIPSKKNFIPNRFNSKPPPPELAREFRVSFTINCETLKLSEIQPYLHIGKLVRVRGIITLCTPVQQLIRVAIYTCDHCAHETYQSTNGLPYLPTVLCGNVGCVGQLKHQNRHSKFLQFQEFQIQELEDDILIGGVPKMLTVKCFGEDVGLKLNETVFVVGVIMPIPFVRNNNTTNIEMEAHEITTVKEELSPLTPEELIELSHPNVYDKLADSIAPEVFGHHDVKKAILLELIGGVDHKNEDINIRGNIHICLVGDPGIAKSQLLRYVQHITTHAQYTTGHGSTSVGLTASIGKNTFGDTILHPGALVLADQSICCVDEFDKFTHTQRISMLEAMEQQTIPIAKAGVSTTLNARVSILAAANPVYGYYDPDRTFQQNVQLPAALLSRFDILWLIRDIPNYENDLRLGLHISHMREHGNVTLDVPFKKSTMINYIRLCKRINPTIPRELGSMLVNNYVEMRSLARAKKNSVFTSPRNLLAVIRLSTALARLRLSTEVIKEDILEAIRLINMSKESIVTPNITKDVSSRVLEVIIDLSQGNDTIMLCDVRNKFQDLTGDLFDKIITDYEELGVVKVNQSFSAISLNV